ncbi:ankyrin repeat domain protein [Colletotrichum higginsianum]|nr:ankyrin repeat domain protein [Colletotrichum higginsianum]
MAEEPTVAKPTLPSLPTEILLDIAELVSDACGRAGLARASRRLCEVANPTLWRHGVQDNLSKMLVQASTTGNLDILKKSVIYGADIDVVHPVSIPEEAKKCYPVPILREQEKDYLFWAAPLHLAVYHGHYDAAKWLVSHGADIEAPGTYSANAKAIEITSATVATLPLVPAGLHCTIPSAEKRIQSSDSCCLPERQFRRWLIRTKSESTTGLTRYSRAWTPKSYDSGAPAYHQM